MKKILFLAIAVATLFASCQKENFAEPTIEATDDFTASFAETRTSLDGTAVVWCEEDLLTIFTKTSHNRKYQVKELSEDGRTATFGYVSFTGSNDVKITSNYALYPYDADATLTGGVVTTTLQSTQTYNAANGNLGYALMAAQSATNNFSFRNAGSLLRFKVSKIVPDEFTLNSIKITSASNNIAGEVTINLNNTEAKAIVTSNGVKEITLTDINYEVTTEVKEFYVAMPSMSFADKDLTVTFVFEEGEKVFELPAFDLEQGKIKSITYAINDAEDFTGGTPDSGDDSNIENPNKKDFTIEVTDIEVDHAAIKVTPSDDKQSFCWIVGVWDGAKTAEEIMNEIVAMYGSWMNSGWMLYSGVQDYTGGPGSPYKYKLDAPDTEYCVIAFGYTQYVGITTDPVMVTFRTLPAPDASETEFNMTASSITPYGFEVNITSSAPSTYYTPGVCTPSEYNEEVLVSEVEAGIAEILEMHQAYDPNITLSQVLGMYYYKGNYTIDASGMQPETTYMGYIFAIDHKTGKVVKTHTFNPLATTTKVGDITPSIELVGIYSGNEEKGQVFGDAYLTKGKAISVFKYSNLDGAHSLFTALLDDNLMNYTDPELWKFGTGYWTSCSMSQPYSFHPTNWDYEYTALAYAVDATTGQPGGIGRATTTPTINNKRDIQELIDLVNELNAAQKSSFSVPKSIVVTEGITLSAVKVETENNVSIRTK